MGCIALVRCVLVLRCGLAGVVWYPYAGFSAICCDYSKLLMHSTGMERQWFWGLFHPLPITRQETEPKTARASYMNYYVGGHEWVHYNSNAWILCREHISGRAGLMPQSFQLRTQVRFASPSGWQQVARVRDVLCLRFCNHSGGGGCIGLLT